MKTFFRKKVVLLLTILLAGFLGYLTWYIATGQDSKQVSATSQAPACSVDAGKLLASINAERSRLGAPQLAIDPSLATSAKAKYDEMVSQQYFGHNRLDGSSWGTLVDRSKVSSAISEDIEMGDLTSAGQWEAFKNSPNHYRSLTDPKYTRVGISSNCVQLTVLHSTGPESDPSIENTTTSDVTVVHLAAPEPAAQPVVVNNSYHTNYTQTSVPQFHTPRISDY